MQILDHEHQRRHGRRHDQGVVDLAEHPFARLPDQPLLQCRKMLGDDSTSARATSAHTIEDVDRTE